MARILLTAELGQGLGHVTQLAPLARELAAFGHKPIFALRDVIAGSRYLGAETYRVVQAPVWQMPPGKATARSLPEPTRICWLVTAMTMKTILVRWFRPEMR